MALDQGIINLLQRAVPDVVANAADMPIPASFAVSPEQVRPFGLSGDLGARHFQSSLDVLTNPLGGNIPVTAVLDGQVSWIGRNVALEPPRDDGSMFITRRTGLLLKVHPRAALGRLVTEAIDDPLEYPLPFWVLYEGVAPDEGLEDRNSMERFAVVDYFDFDTEQIPSAAHAQLDDLVLTLMADPDLRVTLIGHTDAEGSSVYNLDLGMRRAEAVRAYLRGHNVEDERIQIQSMGASAPKDRNPADQPHAGINRRVEIEIRAAEINYVRPGDVIGTATEILSITMLDPLGYFLDPLALLVRLRSELVHHPLAAYRDPLAPLVSSQRIHVISENPDHDAAREASPYFTFHHSLGQAIDAAKDNDTVWVDVSDLTSNTEIACPLTIMGKRGGGGAIPELHPADDQARLLAYSTIATMEQSSTESIYGLRILGLKLRDGRCPGGGSALYISGLQNVQIASCAFQGNFAGPTQDRLSGNGGAIFLSYCRNVLINSCTFLHNKAASGGAIYAEACENIVVAGVAVPGLEDLLASDANYIVDQNTSFPTTLPGIPPALTGDGFTSLFLFHTSTKAGGAIAFKNCAFRISNTIFAGNDSRNDVDPTYGGAVAAQMEICPLDDVESHIAHCVAIHNSASFGGAFGSAGSFDDALALNGNPHSLLGGGLFRLVENVVHQNEAIEIGGGFHLVTGTQHLENNRISQNTATRNGGGLACMSRAVAALIGNRILSNLVLGDKKNLPYTNQSVPPNPVGGGGAGIYVSFWVEPRSCHVTLERNQVIGNVSMENGGGLRATCGAKVTLKPGNLFKDNVAFLHGGAVSLNSGWLTIEGGNTFDGNVTRDGRDSQAQQRFQGGHGGAIYCYAGLVGLGVPELKFATCALDKSFLSIQGTPQDPVHFLNNQATQQGGALYIEREDARTNIICRTLDSQIQRVIFTKNSSSAPISAGGQVYSGSAIGVKNLDAPSLGTTVHVHYPATLTLEDIQIESIDGISVHTVNSTQSVRRTNVTFVHMPGAANVLDEYTE